MSTWDDRKIVDDPRIAHTDPAVRAAAELLHNMESLHLHLDIEDKVCVYCALRASHVLSTLPEPCGCDDEGCPECDNRRAAALSHGAESDTAAQALALAVDQYERTGAYLPMALRLPLEEWRAAQDTELGERLRDQTLETGSR